MGTLAARRPRRDSLDRSHDEFGDHEGSHGNRYEPPGGPLAAAAVTSRSNFLARDRRMALVTKMAKRIRTATPTAPNTPPTAALLLKNPLGFPTSLSPELGMSELPSLPLGAPMPSGQMSHLPACLLETYLFVSQLW